MKCACDDIAFRIVRIPNQFGLIVSYFFNACLSLSSDGPVNAVSVTYLPSPVHQIPQRNVYVSANEVYSYAPNQHALVQPGLPMYGSDASLLQMYRPYVQPSFVPYCESAASRGAKDKDRDDGDLKSGCVSRGIFSENIDDLKVILAPG